MKLERLALLAILAGLGLSSPATPSTDAAGELQRLIRLRLDAYDRGGAAEWARFVDDDCFCGASTKAGVLEAMAARPKGLRNWYGEIRDYAAHFHGGGAVATARYRITESSQLGESRIDAEMWRTETYRRGKDPAWLLIAGADVPIPRQPEVAKVDPNLYDAYVGRYEYSPGVIDTVTREGDRLFSQTTGQEKVELLPENATTFFAKGEDWRVVFTKDDQGHVVSETFRQNGQDLVARRLEPGPP
jgi:hypothetical protein